MGKCGLLSSVSLFLSIFYAGIGTDLQRLFSTFADGWPGRGLLLQRLLTGAALLHCGIVYVTAAPHVEPIAPQIIAACGGILLLAGLWTPLARPSQI